MDQTVNEKMSCGECGTSEDNMWINNIRKPDEPVWLCAKCWIKRLDKELRTTMELLKLERQDRERMFPVSTMDPYPKPYPAQIPWSVAELAYSQYTAKFGNDQSLERLAERGGFGPAELDMFCPGWMDLASEIKKLRNKVIDARRDLIDRDQTIFVQKNKLKVMAEAYDELAAAIGWTKERCNQTGDGPMDIARELLRDVTEQKKELARTNAELDVAIRKIEELSQ
jgi:hypothetical protein